MKSLFAPFTQLQSGVLEGKTDEQGSATDRFREERVADKPNEEELRQRYAGDDEADI